VPLAVIPEAELEAAEAVLWYDDQQPGLGDAFLAELHEAFERIDGRPAEPSRLQSYSGGHEVRRCLLKRFPYIVIYVMRQRPLVVAVSHARRRPLYWLGRLA
jgi:hypothetical protein